VKTALINSINILTGMIGEIEAKKIALTNRFENRLRFIELENMKNETRLLEAELNIINTHIDLIENMIDETKTAA